MAKKILALLLACVMVLAVVGCGKSDDNNGDSTNTAASTGNVTGTDNSGDKVTVPADFKVGFIYIGDENEGYTLAHYNGAKEMMQTLGIPESQCIFKWGIPDDGSYDAAVDLAEAGCNIIFANSFGHEDGVLQAAKEYPDIEFCHATGYKAASSGLKNMHNAFTAVYESRYIAGVLAGCKLNEMIEAGTITADEAKVGYVGAFSFAEVKSGFTSFYLGMKSVCPTVKMEVKYTGSWGNQALEKETAEALISQGCVLVSQHADTTGAAVACEAQKVYNVGYNVSMIDAAPNYAITSASINWGPYVTYAVECALKGEEFPSDWCKGFSDGAVRITEVNKKAFASEESYNNAMAKATEAEDAIKAGTLHVFDTKNWTVDGKTITSTKDIEGYNGLEYIKTEGDVSYFQESTLASAPSFAFIIDGITELNQNFG